MTVDVHQKCEHFGLGFGLGLESHGLGLGLGLGLESYGLGLVLVLPLLVLTTSLVVRPNLGGVRTHPTSPVVAPLLNTAKRCGHNRLPK